ncbi:MAG: hypothetical protein KJO98_16460 [Rhodothermia bacterium]|nr:hypothetical protein [Rhodothermia bacterium]
MGHKEFPCCTRLAIMLPLILGLAAVGCDSTDSDDNGNGSTPELTTKIDYQVVGSYRTCEIVYTGETGDPVDVGEVALDWADSVKVPQNVQFLARLSAKCADLQVEGKAALSILVDGELRATDSVLGFGDSTAVQWLVQPR